MKNRNLLLMSILGYSLVTIGNFGSEDETQWQRDNSDWLDKVELDETGDFFVNVANNKFVPAEDVNFENDWNQVHKVLEVLNQKHGIDICVGNEFTILYNSNIDPVTYNDYENPMEATQAALNYALQLVEATQEVEA